MLIVIAIIVSKMMRHFEGTVQTREKSERGIRKWEEQNIYAEDGERGEVTCDGRLYLYCNNFHQVDSIIFL